MDREPRNRSSVRWLSSCNFGSGVVDICVCNLRHTVSLDRVSRETGVNDLLAVGFDLREAERPSLWV